MLSLREKSKLYLDNIEHPIGRNLNLAILILIWISSGISILETYPILPSIQQFVKAIDTGILVFFLLEYLLRLWCAESKIKQIFSIFGLIDLIAILPLLLGLMDLSFIKIFRWLRILRFFRFIKLELSILKFPNKDSLVITRIILILFTIIFLYSGLIYQIEHSVNPEQFKNFLDAFYFCVVTMTTVGFGDMTPLSETGKFVTLLMILTGVLVIPWQISDLIKQIIKTTSKVENICTNCGLSSHDSDAKFCKSCGNKLPKSE